MLRLCAEAQPDTTPTFHLLLHPTLYLPVFIQLCLFDPLPALPRQSPVLSPLLQWSLWAPLSLGCGWSCKWQQKPQEGVLAEAFQFLAGIQECRNNVSRPQRFIWWHCGLMCDVWCARSKHHQSCIVSKAHAISDQILIPLVEYILFMIERDLPEWFSIN